MSENTVAPGHRFGLLLRHREGTRGKAVRVLPEKCNKLVTSGKHIRAENRLSAWPLAVVLEVFHRVIKQSFRLFEKFL